MKNIAHNIDNMEFMKDIPDNYYELAIIDPEYGINAGTMEMGKGKENKKIKKSKWDKKPADKKYFNELFRISKNQIIFGGNYFHLPIKNSWIVWDKDRKKEVSFSDGELIWTSFDFNLKIHKHKYDGFLGADKDCRIHKCQKPVALYKWLLTNYAKPNDKIFDSHVGSGSIRIACHELGFDFTGCELDKDYYEAQEKRYQEWLKQYNNEFYIGEKNEKNLFNN
jgi:site-specific DNA-methyltransferase (adenine-specific)